MQVILSLGLDEKRAFENHLCIRVGAVYAPITAADRQLPSSLIGLRKT